MAPPTLGERALSSTAPDGTVITTPWHVGHRWTMPAQCSQADHHRDKVRSYLSVMRQFQALAGVIV